MDETRCKGKIQGKNRQGKGGEQQGERWWEETRIPDVRRRRSSSEMKLRRLTLEGTHRGHQARARGGKKGGERRYVEGAIGPGGSVKRKGKPEREKNFPKPSLERGGGGRVKKKNL